MMVPAVGVLADTHCHLDFNAFDSDRSEVIERARQAGVTRIMDPGIDLETSRAAVRLADMYAEVYASIGVHPNSATTWDASSLAELKDLAMHPKVVAVGEIGLDYYRQRAPHNLQQQVFRQQLDLAAELGLPVVIHNREAGADTLSILKTWCTKLVGTPLAERPGVLHSYAGDEPTALQALQLGFWLGITGPVTFRNASEQQRLVADLPLERLLIETDSPFLTPHPHRGRRNEPAFVRLVAEKIAELQKQPIEKVFEFTTASAERLFCWRECV